MRSESEENLFFRARAFDPARIHVLFLAHYDGRARQVHVNIVSLNQILKNEYSGPLGGNPCHLSEEASRRILKLLCRPFVLRGRLPSFAAPPSLHFRVPIEIVDIASVKLPVAVSSTYVICNTRCGDIGEKSSDCAMLRRASIHRLHIQDLHWCHIDCFRDCGHRSFGLRLLHRTGVEHEFNIIGRCA